MLTKLRNAAHQEDGFTLIELLIVVLIIGILAAIAIPVYLGIQNQAHKSTVKADVNIAVKRVQVSLTEGATLASLLGTSTGSDKETITVAAAGSNGNAFTVTGSEAKSSAYIDYVYNYDSTTGNFSEGIIAPTGGVTANGASITATAEASDPTNGYWQTYWGAAATFSSAQAYSGSRSVQSTVSTGTNQYANFFTSGLATVGATYVMTAHVYVSTTDPNAYFTPVAYSGGGGGYSSTYNNDGSGVGKWVTVTAIINSVATDGSLRASFTLSTTDTNAKFYVDDLTFVKQ